MRHHMKRSHDAELRGFASDNYSGVHPEVLDALVEANGGHQIAYGEDVYTERLQEALHAPTSNVVVPVFALANAGVDLRDGVLGDAFGSRLMWGIVLGLVVGKALGIFAGAWASVRLGWGRLPQGVGLGHTLAGGALSGIGFTVSLLIISLAFESSQLQDEARVGVLVAAALASLAGWLAFRFAARFLGQRDAALPTHLSRPVDPARDHITGPVDAPLTLVEYLDFECPFCARVSGVGKELRAHFGDRLRYVTRHLPLPVHPHAELAALGAEAAARQGHYWDMHDVLFAHQDELELEDLVGYAAGLDLDVEEFLRDLDDDDLARHVAHDVASAEESGVRGTPTFFIGETRHIGPHDALTLIAPRLVQGSVMLCDDYDLFRADHQQGERRALQECAARFGIAFEPWFAYGAASRAFLCHVPTLAPAPQP